MTTFDERESAFEAHFALEGELEFKAQARRDRLLGQWVGGLLGLAGEDLDNYVLSVMRADLIEPGDEDVYRKVMGDLAAKPVKMAPHEVRERMELLLQQARREIQSGRRE